MPPAGFELTISAGELPQTYASRALVPADYRVYSYTSVGIPVPAEYATDASGTSSQFKPQKKKNVQ
jgi:hypothetical protein